MTITVPTISFDFYGDTYELAPFFGVYGNGRLAITFLDANDEPFGHLTVNCPNDYLNSGELFIKDWSENEPLVLALIDAGWIKYMGREISSGFVYPKVAVMAGDLLDYATKLGLEA